MNAENKIRKTPVAHVDVLRSNVDIAIAIDVMDQDSLKRANVLLDTALAELRKVAAVTVITKLGRVPGDWLPK